MWQTERPVCHETRQELSDCLMDTTAIRPYNKEENLSVTSNTDRAQSTASVKHKPSSIWDRWTR